MIDMTVLKRAVADNIRLIIGSDLSQQTDPDAPLVTYGTVLNKRPNPKAPIPDYPYALIDVLGIRDTESYLVDTYFDDAEGGIVYITHRLVDVQISLYGETSMQLASKLSVGYRKPDVIDSMSTANIGLYNVEAVQNVPEEYDTNFVERAVMVLTLNVKDVEIIVDEELASTIEIVNSNSELERYEDALDPLPVVLAADTTTP